MVKTHIASHRINPEELGSLAATAGVKEVVAVHLSTGIGDKDTAAEYTARVQAVFAGTFHIGQDLAAF